MRALRGLGFALVAGGVGGFLASGRASAAPLHPAPAALHVHHKGRFSGWVATAGEMASTAPPRPSGLVWIHSVNGLGDVRVNVYAEPSAVPPGDGNAGEPRLDPAALYALDRVLRCKRTGRVRPIDPRLYVLLSLVTDHYGRPIDIVSGFRDQDDHRSKHYKARAVDLHVPGVPDLELRDLLDRFDTGGLGIGLYPNAGFVHLDVRPDEPSYRWIDRSGHKWDGWDGGPPPIKKVARAIAAPPLAPASGPVAKARG